MRVPILNEVASGVDAIYFTGRAPLPDALLARLESSLIMSIDALKTAPRGVAPDHPRIELLRLKGLAAWRQWPVTPWLATAKAKQNIIDFFVATTPLVQWLDDNVGPSTLPRR